MENSKESYSLEGELLEIHTYPAPILKKKAALVTEFNKELETLCKNMLYTMYKAPGIGLAAPQVGSGLRLFVMDIDFDREEIQNADGDTEHKLSNFNPQIFINPVIKDPRGEQIYEEGCLSVPGIYENVKRAEEIVVEYYDIKGNQNTIQVSGLLSICIQHEHDHLEGIVFLERLSMLKKNLLTKKYLKAKKNK